MKVVLVLDDDPAIVGMYEAALKGKYKVVRALNLEQAGDYIGRPDLLAAVIIGAQKQRSAQSAFEIVPRILLAFRGPIIASSGYPDAQEALMAAGCTHSVAKPDCLKPILAILGVPRGQF